MTRLAILLVAVIAVCAGCGAGQSAGSPGPRATGSRPPAASSSSPATVAPMSVISRKVPAYAVAGLYPAGNGNSGTYGPGSASYTGTPPTSLIYDLSRITSAHRRRVLVAWYNDETVWYAAAIRAPYYNEPRDYTIDASAAPGAGPPPGDGDPGWTNLVRVTGNVYNGRQHVVDMHGANWIRMRVTAVNGSPGNMAASFNLDVQDASAGIGDTWLFLGDSITQDGMGHYEPENFMQQVNAAKPPFFPSQLNGGLGGWDSRSVLAIDPSTSRQYLTEFLEAFPGHFVSLAYGTNDANGNLDGAVYRANLETMVKAVLAAGKVPVVPLIPWGCRPSIQAAGPRLNQQVQALWAAYPEIVHGPDFWSYFQAHPELMAPDCIHPTLPQGMAAYRRLTAETMLAAVYRYS